MTARFSSDVIALPASMPGKVLVAVTPRIALRVALYIATLMLTIHLFSMGFHRHALTEHVSDCVSCYSASQVVGGVPVATVLVAAVSVALYCQLRWLPTSRFVKAALFFTPPSHAPPALS